MDPDANLEEQRTLAARMLDGHLDDEDAQRLAELVLAMDEWIGRGGFMPKRWRRREQ